MFHPSTAPAGSERIGHGGNEVADNRLYWTRLEAIADVREYVAVYYNSRRLHSRLGYNTPMNYEKDLNKVSGIT